MPLIQLIFSVFFTVYGSTAVGYNCPMTVFKRGKDITEHPLFTATCLFMALVKFCTPLLCRAVQLPEYLICIKACSLARFCSKLMG